MEQQPPCSNKLRSESEGGPGLQEMEDLGKGLSEQAETLKMQNH